MYGTIVLAFLAYWLGLLAYHKQKSYEKFTDRYLRDGIDLWAAQGDYALSVFRHNWTLMLRVLKQYREFDTAVDIDDFFDRFLELDHTKFQIGPNARIQSVIQTKTIWSAYQTIFSFVTTSNDAIKADFGMALKVMANIENHENKAVFLTEAMKMSDEQNTKSGPLYEIVSLMFQLSELLAKSKYSMEQVTEFSERLDVRKLVESIDERLVKEEVEVPAAA